MVIRCVCVCTHSTSSESDGDACEEGEVVSWVNSMPQRRQHKGQRCLVIWHPVIAHTAPDRRIYSKKN